MVSARVASCFTSKAPREIPPTADWCGGCRVNASVSQAKSWENDSIAQAHCNCYSNILSSFSD